MKREGGRGGGCRQDWEGVDSGSAQTASVAAQLSPRHAWLVFTGSSLPTLDHRDSPSPDPTGSTAQVRVIRLMLARCLPRHAAHATAQPSRLPPLSSSSSQLRARAHCALALPSRGAARGVCALLRRLQACLASPPPPPTPPAHRTPANPFSPSRPQPCRRLACFPMPKPSWLQGGCACNCSRQSFAASTSAFSMPLSHSFSHLMSLRVLDRKETPKASPVNTCSHAQSLPHPSSLFPIQTSSPKPTIARGTGIPSTENGAQRR